MIEILAPLSIETCIERLKTLDNKINTPLVYSRTWVKVYPIDTQRYTFTLGRRGFGFGRRGTFITGALQSASAEKTLIQIDLDTQFDPVVRVILSVAFIASFLLVLQNFNLATVSLTIGLWGIGFAFWLIEHEQHRTLLDALKSALQMNGH